mmetsp:Transcript_28066/g.36265  ORF Transcript_28066/g.36265 Transcript_28066/m.36265 type:complete len:107 (+) Transcript_28066:245-565(+)
MVMLNHLVLGTSILPRIGGHESICAGMVIYSWMINTLQRKETWTSQRLGKLPLLYIPRSLIGIHMTPYDHKKDKNKYHDYGQLSSADKDASLKQIRDNERHESQRD